MKITVWELPFDWETFTAWLGKTFFKRFFFLVFQKWLFSEKFEARVQS